MLLVKTEIGPSKIHGMGLFAAEFIPKGTIIWRFTAGFDIEASETDLKKLPQVTRDQFLHYSYRDAKTDMYVLCFDDACFMNHSDTPNEEGGEPFGYDGDIAIRDIHEGEELTFNYKKEDADYVRKFGIMNLLNDFEKQNLPPKKNDIILKGRYI